MKRTRMDLGEFKQQIHVLRERGGGALMQLQSGLRVNF